MTCACRRAGCVPSEPLETDRGNVGEARTDVLRSTWDDAAGDLARLAGALGVAPGRAEDVLQDVYLAALRKAPLAADRVELRRWLFRVTINRCRLEHRKGARWQRAWQRLQRLWHGGEAECPAAAASREEEKQLIRTALQRLDPACHEVLVLRYFAEQDSQEIGRILNMPPATVRSRLRTARQELADELLRLGYSHE
jgi:RNA polymerase sigma factor (sigma-70 family)